MANLSAISKILESRDSPAEIDFRCKLDEHGFRPALLMEDLDTGRQIRLYYVLSYIYYELKRQYRSVSEIPDDGHILFTKVESELGTVAASLLDKLYTMYYDVEMGLIAGHGPFRDIRVEGNKLVIGDVNWKIPLEALYDTWPRAAEVIAGTAEQKWMDRKAQGLSMAAKAYKTGFKIRPETSWMNFLARTGNYNQLGRALKAANKRVLDRLMVAHREFLLDEKYKNFSLGEKISAISVLLNVAHQSGRVADYITPRGTELLQRMSDLGSKFPSDPTISELRDIYNNWYQVTESWKLSS